MPSKFPHYPVAVRYLAGPYEYGRDMGVVSFTDGWLLFQGMRTSWSIQKWYVHHDAESCGNRLELNLEGRPRSIELLPYDGFDGAATGLRPEFQRELSSWFLARPEFQHAVWPPLNPTSDYVVANYDIRRLCFYFTWFSGIAVIASLAAGGLGFGRELTVVLGFAGFAGITVPLVWAETARGALRAVRPGDDANIMPLPTGRLR